MGEGHEIDGLVRTAYRPDRLYPILGDKYYGFYAGRLADGRQALVTRGYPRTVCVYLFTADGKYLGVERREPALTAEPEEPGLATNEAELYDFLATEFGFAAGLIRVKRFSEPSECVSIEALPEHLAEIAADPASVPADERLATLEDLRRWVEEGAFELNTWNNYWLDASGEVTSS